METCAQHGRLIEEIGKRPKATAIWVVVGILLSICTVVLTTAFSSIQTDVEKIQLSTEKIQAAVVQNSKEMAVMRQDYTTWKKNAPPYHTHHSDGRITKP